MEFFHSESLNEILQIKSHYGLEQSKAIGEASVSFPHTLLDLKKYLFIHYNVMNIKKQCNLH